VPRDQGARDLIQSTTVQGQLLGTIRVAWSLQRRSWFRAMIRRASGWGGRRSAQPVEPALPLGGTRPASVVRRQFALVALDTAPLARTAPSGARQHEIARTRPMTLPLRRVPSPDASFGGFRPAWHTWWLVASLVASRWCGRVCWGSVIA